MEVKGKVIGGGMNPSSLNRSTIAAPRPEAPPVTRMVLSRRTEMSRGLLKSIILDL